MTKPTRNTHWFISKAPFVWAFMIFLLALLVVGVVALSLLFFDGFLNFKMQDCHESSFTELIKLEGQYGGALTYHWSYKHPTYLCQDGVNIVDVSSGGFSDESISFYGMDKYCMIKSYHNFCSDKTVKRMLFGEPSVMTISGAGE